MRNECARNERNLIIQSELTAINLSVYWESVCRKNDSELKNVWRADWEVLKSCLSTASSLESIILIHECDCSRLYRAFWDCISVGKVGHVLIDDKQTQDGVTRGPRMWKNINNHKIYVWFVWFGLSGNVWFDILILFSQQLESTFYPRLLWLGNDRFGCSCGIQQVRSLFKGLQIIDRRFRSLIPSYIRDSSVAAIVYDVTSNFWFLLKG